MKSLYDYTRRQYIRLWITYGSAFVLVFVAGYFLSRGVVNQPWTARTHMGAAVVGDLLYVVGGQSQVTGDLLDDIWEINLSLASLRSVAQLPYGCYRPETAVSQGKLFVLGGHDGESYRSEILQVADNSVDITARLPSPRAYGATVGVDNILYYAGGWDGGDMLDEIVAINLDSGEVAVIGHLPTPRRFVSAAKVGNLIYFLGGEGLRAQLSDEIVEFDPSTQRIVRVGHLPTGRYLVNAIEHDGDLLVLGGKDTLSLGEVVFVDLSGIEISARVTDELSELSWNLAVVAIDDRMFIVGGSHPDFSRAIGLAEYLPDSSPSLIPIKLRKNPWK